MEGAAETTPLLSQSPLSPTPKTVTLDLVDCKVALNMRIDVLNAHLVMLEESDSTLGWEIVTNGTLIESLFGADSESRARARRAKALIRSLDPLLFTSHILNYYISVLHNIIGCRAASSGVCGRCFSYCYRARCEAQVKEATILLEKVLVRGGQGKAAF